MFWTEVPKEVKNGQHKLTRGQQKAAPRIAKETQLSTTTA